MLNIFMDIPLLLPQHKYYICLLIYSKGYKTYTCVDWNLFDIYTKIKIYNSI